MSAESHEPDIGVPVRSGGADSVAPLVEHRAVTASRAWRVRQAVRALIVPPSEWLQRVRRAFLLLSLIGLVLVITTIRVSVEHDQIWMGMIFPMLIWLGCRWTQEYRRPSSSPLWDCADGFALLLASLALDRLDSSSGFVFLFLLYSSLAFRSLALNGRRVTIGVLIYLIVYLTAAAVEQSATLIDHVSTLLFMPIPPLIMIGGASHLLAITLAGRDRDVAHRQRLLDAVADLAASSDQREVANRAVTIARSNCPEPGHVTVALVADGVPGRTMLAVVGQVGDDVVGKLIDDSLAPALLDSICRNEVLELTGSDADILARMIGSSVGHPSVLLVPVDGGTTRLGCLCVVSDSRLPDDCRKDLAQLGGHIGTAWQRALEADRLRQRESTFRSLVQHSSDAITVLSADFTIMYQTPVLARMLGVDASALVGLSLLDLVHPDDLGGAITFLEALSDRREELPPAEWRLQCEDGSWLPVETTGTNMLDDPQISGLLLTSRDIRDRRLLEDRLRHQAFHDPLTMLPNRALFLQELEAGLRRPLRRSVSHAVMFLDLDRFKTINDSLGHEAGDQLLRTIADRLRECVRGEDLVARLGGDEFAVLLHDIIDDVPAVEIAERILHRMTEPVYLNGHEIAVTTSIGIALGSALHDTPDRMLRNADVAMYEAKRQGKACYALFSSEMNAHALERLTLESELRNAVRNNQLEVHYQPLVSIEMGRIDEVEALVRWNHPRLGLLSPAEFISLAEETGLILPIGEWVLYEACRQVRAWQEHQPERSRLALSVNLSARQFQQQSIVSDVAHVLKESGLNAGLLKIEITESVAMMDQQMTIEMLHRLRELGIRLAIDDFGIGYSSLSSLKHFPVDTLKIDRAFVAGLGQDRGDTAIVGAVIAFAKALELSVTAEGIETMQQLIRLRALKCDQGQGYLFARPLDQYELEPLLAKLGRPVAEPAVRQADRLRLVTNLHGAA